MSRGRRSREVGCFPGLDETKLLAILDAVPVRIAFIDRDRRHVYANREHAERLGIPAQEFVGKTIVEILGEEYYEKLKPFGDRALAGETVEWEGWLQSPQFGNRYARRIYKPYIGPDGTIDGFLILVHDRTDEKLKQEALDRERLRLLDAVESFSEGFALWDAEDRLVMCNSRYREMYAAVGPANLRPGTSYWDHAVALVRSGTTHVRPEEAEEFVRERVAWRQNPGRPVMSHVSMGAGSVRSIAGPAKGARCRSAST
jgi:PAS domain S-box-containing protein